MALFASHLAAMPRGLRGFEPIGFDVVWRDAWRCDRSRVDWISCSEIGVEGPIWQGGLRGFVGMLGSPRGARGRWDLTESALAELPKAARAPTDTYLFVSWGGFEDAYGINSRRSV